MDENEDAFLGSVNNLVRKANPVAKEGVVSATAVDTFLKGCLDKRVALIVANNFPPVNVFQTVHKVKSVSSSQFSSPS